MLTMCSPECLLDCLEKYKTVPQKSDNVYDLTIKNKWGYED